MDQFQTLETMLKKRNNMLNSLIAEKENHKRKKPHKHREIVIYGEYLESLCIINWLLTEKISTQYDIHGSDIVYIDSNTDCKNIILCNQIRNLIDGELKKSGIIRLEHMIPIDIISKENTAYMIKLVPGSISDEENEYRTSIQTEIVLEEELFENRHPNNKRNKDIHYVCGLFSTFLMQNRSKHKQGSKSNHRVSLLKKIDTQTDNIHYFLPCSTVVFCTRQVDSRIQTAFSAEQSTVLDGNMYVYKIYMPNHNAILFILLICFNFDIQSSK